MENLIKKRKAITVLLCSPAEPHTVSQHFIHDASVCTRSYAAGTPIPGHQVILSNCGSEAARSRTDHIKLYSWIWLDSMILQG